MSSLNDNPSPRTTGFANASIILAIATLLAGPFSAVPAIICGHMALSRMRKNPAIVGYGRALAGTILGYSFLIMFAFFVLMVFGWYFWLAAPAPPPG